MTESLRPPVKTLNRRTFLGVLGGGAAVVFTKLGMQVPSNNPEPQPIPSRLKPYVDAISDINLHRPDTTQYAAISEKRSQILREATSAKLNLTSEEANELLDFINNPDNSAYRAWVAQQNDDHLQAELVVDTTGQVTQTSEHSNTISFTQTRLKTAEGADLNFNVVDPELAGVGDTSGDFVHLTGVAFSPRLGTDGKPLLQTDLFAVRAPGQNVPSK